MKLQDIFFCVRPSRFPHLLWFNYFSAAVINNFFCSGIIIYFCKLNWILHWMWNNNQGTIGRGSNKVNGKWAGLTVSNYMELIDDVFLKWGSEQQRIKQQTSKPRHQTNRDQIYYISIFFFASYIQYVIKEGSASNQNTSFIQSIFYHHI